METAYREWEKRRQDRPAGRRTAGRGKTGAKRALGARERRRLLQLLVCVVLFLVVFIGKGVFPDRLSAMRNKMLETIRADTDFKAAFASLGRSISAGEPVLDTLGDLWVDVFAGGTVTVSFTEPLEHAPSYRAEQAFFADPDKMGVVFHLAGVEPPAEQTAPPPAEVQPAAPAEPEPVPAQPEPAVPTVVQMPYDGAALPDNTTMDKYALGLAQTATPALGWVSSAFGWREHPVDGGEKFHNGVDLAVNDGTDVKAFADGVVDYIGESPIYGQYLQLRHAGGVTTFSAHCSRLWVQQGQTVTVGEKVAESGETGNATGPHLHFEIKLNGVRLNPVYYIETE